MPTLPYYARIKDKYCIAYFGFCSEYCVQLALLRPQLEEQFPGVLVWLAVRDDFMYLLDGERILPYSRFKDSKHEFAYVRELLGDMQSTPVEKFLEESGVEVKPVRAFQPSAAAKTVILTNAVLPNRPLTPAQVAAAKAHSRRKGFEAQVDSRWEDAGWVIAPECAELYLAASAGKNVTLVPTGFGEKLFLKMFPAGEILKLPA
jgi:hypothetical protein